MNTYVSRHLKEELAWAINEQLQVISNVMLFRTVISFTHGYVLHRNNPCNECYGGRCEGLVHNK